MRIVTIRKPLVSDMKLVAFLCPLSDDGVINRSLITQTYGAISRPPFPLCYKHSCQEDMRSKDRKTSKTFSQKKSNEPLDTMTNVIYVTRITTECTTVFVSASACNYPFGQGYAH